MNPFHTIRTRLTAALMSVAVVPISGAHAQCFQSSGYLPADQALGLSLPSCEVVSSLDGNTLLVAGSLVTDIYTKSATQAGWTLQASLPPPSGQLSRTGAISDDGNIVVVMGSAAAYVYTRTGTTWTLAQTIVENGYLLNADMSSDGSRLFIGNATTGTIDVYARSGQQWALEAHLAQPPVTPAASLFGFRINCSADGRSVVATGNTNMVATYDLVSNVWTPRPALAPLGTIGFDSLSIAMDRSGTLLAFGHPPSGRVFAYQRTPGNATQAPGPWVFSQIVLPSGGLAPVSFGVRVAWSPIGEMLAVGDSGVASGVVHVYAGESTGQLLPAFYPLSQANVPAGVTAQGFGAQLSWASTGLVVVSNDVPATGNINGAIRLMTAPSSAVSITQNPQTQNILTGQQAVFTIATSGATTPTYRWRRNGQPLIDGPLGIVGSGLMISGSATPTLTLTNTAYSDTGSVYDCVTASGCQTITSAPAALIVSNPCRADFNNSGSVSVQDIFDFLSAYFTGCP